MITEQYARPLLLFGVCHLMLEVRLARRSVLIALGKRLFSFRTQKLSPAAAIILSLGKVARRRIIQTTTRTGWFLFVL